MFIEEHTLYQQTPAGPLWVNPKTNDYPLRPGSIVIVLNASRHKSATCPPSLGTERNGPAWIMAMIHVRKA